MKKYLKIGGDRWFDQNIANYATYLEFDDKAKQLSVIINKVRTYEKIPIPLGNFNSIVSTLSSIPALSGNVKTKLSEFENDTGFITNDALSGYLTNNDVSADTSVSSLFSFEKDGLTLKLTANQNLNDAFIVVKNGQLSVIPAESGVLYYDGTNYSFIETMICPSGCLLDR